MLNKDQPQTKMQREKSKVKKKRTEHPRTVGTYI